MSTGSSKKISDVNNDSNKIQRNFNISPPKLSADSKLKEVNTRLNSIRVISRKHSSKIMRINFNNPTQDGMASDRRKKQFELQKVYNSTSSNVLNSSYKARCKIKAIVNNTINFKEFHFSIDRELDILEKSENSTAEEYLKTLEKIISKDEQFSHLLLRVMKGLQLTIKNLEGKYKVFETTENKSLPVKSLNFSKKNSEDFGVIKIREKSFAGNAEFNCKETQKNSKIYSRTMVTPEKSNLENMVQELQQEIESLKQKESKFELLVKAMKDRGYPVEHVYATDVLYMEKNKNEDCEGLLYVNENLYSLSSDLSQEIE